MNLRQCTGTVTAKIMMLTAFLFLVMLIVSLVYSFFAERRLAEEFAMQQARSVADSYFDGLNKLMLSGGMGEREKLHAAIIAQPNVVAAHVARGEAVSKQYGPGLPGETAQGELDRKALAGEEQVTIA